MKQTHGQFEQQLSTIGTDPANHPANNRLTDERLIRVRDELQRTLTYRNGSTTSPMMR